MTRLTTDDLAGISRNLDQFDRELAARTGRNLLDLAALAAGPEPGLAERISGTRVAVVPLTCGLGLIPGFAETVRDIAGHLGFTAWVAPTDASGLAQAYERRADLIVTADDHFFAAINLNTKLVADNDQATGRGFVRSLEGLAGGLAGRRVLVIGCGPVGRQAALAAMDLGARVAIHDLVPGLASKWVAQVNRISERPLTAVSSIEAALVDHRLVVEATPARDVIADDLFSQDLYLAAPGVPLGISPETYLKHGSRVVHDPLSIGTATMLLMALRSDCPGGNSPSVPSAERGFDPGSTDFGRSGGCGG